MSTCNRLRDEQLTLFAYGEEEAPEVALHLAQCPACRARLEEARMVRAAAAALAPVEPPAKLVRALRAEAAQVAQKRRRGRPAAWWLIPASALAAAALLLVGLYLYDQRRPDETLLAGMAPLNLDRIETDLDRRLGEIGVPSDGTAVGGDLDAWISDPEADLETAAVAPATGDEAPAPSIWYEPEDLLDQIEVALLHLEKDVGLEPAGDDPVKGEWQ